MARWGLSSSALVDNMPHDSIMEVLSWLPGKSLMRFKSVSKHWFSLITHPVFVEMHHTRSYVRKGSAILLCLPWDNFRKIPGRDGFFFVFIMKESEIESASYREMIHCLPWLQPDNIIKKTNIVNGLICFYDRRSNMAGSISLYNLTTRENLPLPSSKERTSIRINCFLGFAPVNKEYKVLSILKNELNGSNSLNCDILTVGNEDRRWRPLDISYIDDIIGLDFLSGEFNFEKGLCLDGVLYWTSWEKRFNTKKVVVMFDLEHEKFEIIKYPPGQLRGATLAHIQGHLSLVLIDVPSCNQLEKLQITLWKLVNRKNNDNPLWTKEVTTCQFPICRSRMQAQCCSTGEVFSMCVSDAYADEAIVDCYDLETCKYKELRISNQGLVPFRYCGFSTSLVVENIIPLKK